MKELEADSFFEIRLFGTLCLVHIEFQSYADEHMGKRMWGYNTSATVTYDLPTYSFLIYLRPCKVTEPFFHIDYPTQEKVHHFWFKIIKLWELRVEDIQRTGLTGIFPLMILAKDGKQPKVVEQIIHKLEEEEPSSSRELLSLTYILASMVFEKETDREWLKRRFAMFHNALRDAWAYQEIMQEGREEGLEKGLQEGLQQGLQQGLQEGLQQGLHEQRLTLLEIVKQRFPSLVPLAQRKVDAITESAALRHLLVMVSVAQTEEQAQQALRDGDNQEQKI